MQTDPLIPPATSLTDFFTHDHRACDAAWTELENTSPDDEQLLQQRWQRFSLLMERHMDWEERVLFPAFERKTGMNGGPTQVMRAEHEQMRALLRQMAGRAAVGELDELLDQGDTLLMLIQQHNIKEESVLYPMAEGVLAEQWSALAQQMR